MKRVLIHIEGCVQGVGARPFICRLARDMALTGSVFNDSSGVTIYVQGASETVDDFTERLRCRQDMPPLMRVSAMDVSQLKPVEGQSGFSIAESSGSGEPVSQVTVDTALCGDCLREMQDVSDFRYRYAFINCTNCGPRYSIIKNIPYDRPSTTMADFRMCDRCRAQYNDVSDRRFHAQPVACRLCGPAVCLADSSGTVIDSDAETAIAETAEIIRKGKIAAIKGIGGFHLAVDALNEQAVERLRQRKGREYKPFAMMAGSVETIRRYADVLEAQRILLQSPQRPIVLLRKKTTTGASAIAKSVAAGTGTFGFMLCYAPLHYLLFGQEGIELLVMTSGNISYQPLICDNDEAVEKLGGVADVFLMHNRDIYRQIDDSVVHVIGEKPAIIRRSRGYVPEPILRCPGKSANGGDSKTAGGSGDVFAAGSDLKNTFCLLKGQKFILSEHIGDLGDALVYRHYVRSVEHLMRLFDAKPRIVACDLHPGYLSTQYAQSLPHERLIRVQHHWAHVAATLAEFGEDRQVLGLVADGTGFGSDGAIWGCECMAASLRSFRRLGHLRYYKLCGGDLGAKEPIRPLLGLIDLYAGCGFDGASATGGDYERIIRTIEPDRHRLRILGEQIAGGVNTVMTSSLGRVFDAAAAILGLGNFNHFDAQLPMALESVISNRQEETGGDFAASAEGCYDFKIADGQGADGCFVLDLGRAVRSLIKDRLADVDTGLISARFHNTIAHALCAMAVRARQETGISVALPSGGCFCNRYLTQRLIKMLKENGFDVLFSTEVPVNDGAIALGQAAIAAELAGCTKG